MAIKFETGNKTSQFSLKILKKQTIEKGSTVESHNFIRIYSIKGVFHGLKSWNDLAPKETQSAYIL